MKNRRKSINCSNILEHIPTNEFKLLVDLCKIQSNSQNEHIMVAFIVEWLLTYFPDVPYYIDRVGNIIITKGKEETYPCIVAHLDTVHTIIKDYSVWVEYYSDIKSAPNKLIAKNSKGEQVGIGGDDKCGIFTCLYFLKYLPSVKIILFTREETGCIGSNGVDHAVFNNCRYIIQLDRRGAGDFIDKYSNGNTVSHNFKSEIGSLKKEYKFKSEIGIITDSINLFYNNVGISCCNISSGFYLPHTQNEYIKVDELWNSIKLVQDMIHILKPMRYTHIYTPPASVNIRYYNTTTKYDQCSFCKSWIISTKGFNWQRFNNVFVCYKCYVEKSKTLCIDKTKDMEDTKGNVVWRTCTICHVLKKEKEGVIYINNPYYDGFVCNNCDIDSDQLDKLLKEAEYDDEDNIKEKSVSPLVENSLVDACTDCTETTPDCHETCKKYNMSEQCISCQQWFIQPLATGIYKSVKPVKWICLACNLKERSDENASI